MTTEINNLIQQGLAKPGLRQSPVSTQTPTSVPRQKPELNTDNIVRVDFDNRQELASNRLQTQDTNSRTPSGRNAESISQSLNTVNSNAQAISRKLEFRVDENSGRTVITVRDSDTQEVIRQIPSEQLLEVAARIEEIQQEKRTDPSIEALGILFTAKT